MPSTSREVFLSNVNKKPQKKPSHKAILTFSTQPPLLSNSNDPSPHSYSISKLQANLPPLSPSEPQNYMFAEMRYFPHPRPLPPNPNHQPTNPHSLSFPPHQHRSLHPLHNRHPNPHLRPPPSPTRIRHDHHPRHRVPRHERAKTPTRRSRANDVSGEKRGEEGDLYAELRVSGHYLSARNISAWVVLLYHSAQCCAPCEVFSWFRCSNHIPYSSTPIPSHQRPQLTN